MSLNMTGPCLTKPPAVMGRFSESSTGANSPRVAEPPCGFGLEAAPGAGGTPWSWADTTPHKQTARNTVLRIDKPIGFLQIRKAKHNMGNLLVSRRNIEGKQFTAEQLGDLVPAARTHTRHPFSSTM